MRIFRVGMVLREPRFVEVALVQVQTPAKAL